MHLSSPVGTQWQSCDKNTGYLNKLIFRWSSLPSVFESYETTCLGPQAWESACLTSHWRYSPVPSTYWEWVWMTARMSTATHGESHTPTPFLSKCFDSCFLFADLQLYILIISCFRKQCLLLLLSSNPSLLCILLFILLCYLIPNQPDDFSYASGFFQEYFPVGMSK